MKKKLIVTLAMVLVVALCSCLFVACSGEKIDEAVLAKCLTELEKDMRKADSITAGNYVIIGATPAWFDADGKEWSVAISWAVEGTTEVTVSKREDGRYDVKVPEDVTAEIAYKLVGTLVNEKGEPYKNAEGKAYACTANKVVPAGKGAGTEAAPYSVIGALTDFATLTDKSYSESIVYVRGIIVDEPTYSSQYTSYTFWMADSINDTNKLQGYSVRLGTGVTTVPHKNDTILVSGYIEKFGSTLEITYQKDDKNNYEYSYIHSITPGTSSITAAANENATITLDATSGANGSTFTFSVEAKNGMEIGSVKVGNTTVTAGENGKYTGTIAGDTVVSVVTIDPNASNDAIEVDMRDAFGTYASGWSNSYASLDLTSADLGISSAALAINISAGSKQTGTITDMPTVAAKKDVPAYITITADTGTISEITFNLSAWGGDSTKKEFTVLCIEYSVDGTNWVVAEGVGVVAEDGQHVKILNEYTSLSATLPEGVKAVRLHLEADYVYQDKAQNQQVGFAGFVIKMGD